MLPINSIYSFASFTNAVTDYSAMALAFQRGIVSGQQYVQSLITTMIKTRTDEFLSLFSDACTFLQPVDIIVDYLQEIANYLPQHLRKEFWEYARMPLKEQMTALLQANHFSAESIQRLSDFIDTMIDARIHWWRAPRGFAS